eukprot:CAMPEP_0171457330 /NCGR_PEP_ID=MMETSP0945-20130129/3456_1 /TAXON_ID=109269 /ORGANISM="Vaucheria litorea, Strain CCMP2940" /LENGTH=122 /DNA_ID=CAMNT_0011982925 /DNA_START=43 /DNA_END=408 /DNA_ORIENTATION=+
MRLIIIAVIVASLFQVGAAFGAASSFSSSHRVRFASQANRRRINTFDMMMGKSSKFGIFSPVVIIAKIALGETRLNKIRGKVIASHSQTITSFCTWVGADPKLRGQLIKKAKMTGDDLGFLW